MKRDLYTKFILTVIAICLVWICLRDINLSPAPLYASPTPGRNAMDVNIVDSDAFALQFAGPIKVEVSNWPSSLMPENQAAKK